MSEKGFTLLEVVVAVGILSMGLVSLIEVVAGGLRTSGRARELTFVTLLARSKIVDIEQNLEEDGFSANETEEEGNFEEEGREDLKWSYRIAPLEIDLSNLTSFCSLMGDEDEDSGCASMLSGFSGPLDALTREIANSIRFVELKLTWTEGKYTRTEYFREIVSNKDFRTNAPGLMPTGSFVR